MSDPLQHPAPVNDNNRNWLRLRRFIRAKNTAWFGLLIWTVAAALFFYGYIGASFAACFLCGCCSLVSIAISKGWVR